MTTLERLAAFARARWPNAEVWVSPSSGEYNVRVTVSRKQLLADREAALRALVRGLTPREPPRPRRLYWGRRRPNFRMLRWRGLHA